MLFLISNQQQLYKKQLYRSFMTKSTRKTEALKKTSTLGKRETEKTKYGKFVDFKISKL